MIAPLLVFMAYVGVYILFGLPVFTPCPTWPKILWEITKRILAYVVCWVVLAAIYLEVVLPWFL